MNRLKETFKASTKTLLIILFIILGLTIIEMVIKEISGYDPWWLSIVILLLWLYAESIRIAYIKLKEYIKRNKK